MGALVLLGQHEEDEIWIGHAGLFEAAHLPIRKHARAHLKDSKKAHTQYCGCKLGIRSFT